MWYKVHFKLENDGKCQNHWIAAEDMPNVTGLMAMQTLFEYGFGLTDDMTFVTNLQEAHYWIPPGQITFIEVHHEESAPKGTPHASDA